MDFSDLLRRADLTSKARYHAARRMSLHAWFSQWTLTLLALGQMVMSLVPALHLRNNFSDDYTNFGAIFFGALVLGYSLLIGMANYGARAVQIHACGIEIGRLARDLHGIVSSGAQGTKQQYDDAVQEYYDILQRYENHARIDYLVARYDYDNAIFQNKEIAFPCSIRPWYRLRKLQVMVQYHYVGQFIHYVATVGLMGVWIYFMTR